MTAEEKSKEVRLIKRYTGMKKILLLGGSAQQVIAIETAKRMGLFTVLCDYLPDNPGQNYADRFYQVSTTEREAVFQVAQREQVDFVIAYASDPAAPTAAYVAERMGLPTNPLAAVETLCHKDLFRQFLTTHGFNTPMAKGYRRSEDVCKEIQDFKLPVIIKPVDSSGSKGATVLNDLSNLNKAIDYAFSYSRTHRLIVEEFIEKDHPYLVGGDIFVSDGIIIQWGLMNCHRDSRVNPLVPVGKSFPPIMSEGTLNEVKKTLQMLVTKLGIKFGPMNVELIADRYGRVYPIDIGPRNGGNMIPDLLGMIFGCDVVEMSIQAAMGKSICVANTQEQYYFATLNLHSDREGSFLRVDFSQEIEQYIVKKCIYKKPGEKVHFFSNAADALGIVFFHFPDQNTMICMEENAGEHVKIILQGDE